MQPQLEDGWTIDPLGRAQLSVVEKVQAHEIALSDKHQLLEQVRNRCWVTLQNDVEEHISVTVSDEEI